MIIKITCRKNLDMLPSQSKVENGCNSSGNERLFLETMFSTFGLHSTATMGENEL